MKEIIDYELIEKKYRLYSSYCKYYYPIKVNDNPHLIHFLNRLGCYYEVDEVNRAMKMINEYHVNPKRILFVLSYIKNESELDMLIRLGVTFFSIDSIELLDAFKKYSNINFLVRMSISTFNICANTYDRFGANKQDTHKIIEEINKYKSNFVGLHFHLFLKKNYMKYLKIIVNQILSEFSNFSILNIGGGINENYLPKIIEYLNRKHYTGNVICESGYNFINDSINIETTVLAIKKIRNHICVIIDIGIYTGLLDIYLDKRRFALENKEKKKSKKKKYRLYGPSFDFRDYIGEYYLENLKVNDKIIIKGCGAYVCTLKTNFYSDYE